MTHANVAPQAGTLLSRHTTSEGVVVWSRCACGRLRMDLVPYTPGTERLSASSCPRCATPLTAAPESSSRGLRGAPARSPDIPRGPGGE
ncbi:hypothetical protein GEV43_29390 [Actinomadura sp. J1-007]|nr:hypothetical protein [Actinomadura sp. J1-007]